MAIPSYQSVDGEKVSAPIAPEFRVYIEGVQVPFNTISVSSVYQELPTAQVVVPYLPYLQEIARNYRPKIHVFYTDGVTQIANYKKNLEDDLIAKDSSFKVLFIGEIVASSYSKSKTPFSSSSNITFSCVHKNSAVQEMMMRLAAFSTSEGSANAAATQTEANAPVMLSNPGFLSTQVVQGIDTTKVFDLSDPAKTDPSGVPAHLAERYKQNFAGMPGVLLRLWNIICTDAKNLAYTNDVMQRLYVPLFTNLKFFDGITSHKTIEQFLEANRAPLSEERKTELGKAADGVGSNPGTAVSPLKASFNSFDALAADIQIQSIQGLLNSEVQSMGFLDLAKRLMSEFFYEMITLNSPVQRFDKARELELGKTDDIYEKLAILEGDNIAPGETIVKPVMPIYFAPKCNVLYPKMYSSIQVNDSYAQAPSRVEVLLTQMGPITLPLALNFRSPPQLRQAFLDRSFNNAKDITTPIDTYSIIGNTVSPAEVGKGVKSKGIRAPGWMSIVAQKDSDTSEIKDGFKQLLTQYSDYEYSIAVSSTRNGAVEGIFNPYIIPGYPMDIIDPGIYRPSYHAFCTSVTHSISASGNVSTSIGFTNAISYDELYAVDTPMALPWLVEALGMKAPEQKGQEISYSKLTGLLDTDVNIRDAANTYYQEVLGVGAAFPDALSGYSYATDLTTVPTLLEIDVEEILQASRTPEESLSLARRPIQSKPNVAEVYKVVFIETETAAFQAEPGAKRTDFLYNAPSVGTNEVNLSFIRTQNGKLGTGFNAFLDYDSFKTTKATVPQQSNAPVSTSGSNAQPQASTGGNSTGVDSFSNFQVKRDWESSFARFKGKYPSVAATIDELESSLRASFSDYPQNLFKQIIHVESSYNPVARNSIAFGLGQLTYKFFQKRYPVAFNESETGYIQNARVSAQYLTRLKRQFSSFTWNDVAVAYNQGEGTVLNCKKSRPNKNADYSACRLDKGGLAYFNKVFDTSKPRT